MLKTFQGLCFLQGRTLAKNQKSTGIWLVDHRQVRALITCHLGQNDGLGEG